jgi:GH15 family glucan-1,4-alpha-glucosidase
MGVCLSTMNPARGTSTRIEDYALIGDCETGALVSRRGSIDWLCWPRFDSHACFAALLGEPANGRWLLTAADADARVSRAYRESTMILETVYETAEGSARVTDFMPLRGTNSDLVRIVSGIRGRLAMRTELIMRFDYGSVVPWVTRHDDGSIRAVAGPDMLVLRSDVEMHGENLTTVGEFTIAAGDTAAFVLTWSPSHLPPPPVVDPHRAFVESETFWLEWSSRCTYKGIWGEPVRRSLLTLKALTYAPTGGIVAALTTSLPEHIGGIRNWDYRYCWVRDATLTLLALMDGGYYEEAAAWRDWLLRAAAGSPKQVQIMYGVAGERLLSEWEVPWLAGYEGSRPVRIGNAAHTQLQLDVYGEVADALHQARKSGMKEPIEAWRLQHALTEHVSEAWESADRGIWEVRGAPRHFTHSKVMSWVALDRAIGSAEAFGLDAPLDRWRATRDRIRGEVLSRGFSGRTGSFRRSYDSDEVDASLLLIPVVGFLPATDPRVLGTIAEVERSLLVDGFVRRYDTRNADDGLPPGEGAFLACSFWLADNYMLAGRDADARALFERLIALRNDVGLLAEEYDPALRRQVGNFPQAFSHVALVDTALNLGQEQAQNAPKPAEQRAEERRSRPR